MNPNQYYGAPPNFMPMPNGNPYYHPSMMSPRAPGPAPPQINQVPQLNPQVMKQPMPIPQYSQPQYQYSNIQSGNYSAISPGMQNSTPFQPSQPDQASNQANFQYGHPSNILFCQNQTVPTPNYNAFPNPNQYADTANMQGVYNTGQPFQKSYSAPTDNPGNYYPAQGDPQHLTYTPTPNTPTSMPTPQAGEPMGIINNEPQQSKEPPQEVQAFKPTNVIGEYKCSAFPNLFTGPFRYSGPSTQRKPFTLRNDSMRHSSQPNSERRTQIGLTRHAKRWELRGGKYYGCFTSRTNGLQDNCPKAKCKLCPTDRRK